MTIQIHRNRTAITRTTFSKPYRLLIEKKDLTAMFKKFAAIALTAVVWLVSFSGASPGTARAVAPGDPSIIRVEYKVSAFTNAVGTAFAVGPHDWVTAAHVVTTDDGKQVSRVAHLSGLFSADVLEVVAVDKANDLALLHSDAAAPEWLPLARESAEQAGYGVGYPGNPFRPTSARLAFAGRGESHYDEYALKPAALYTGTVYGGDSGGPIVNDAGEVIGVMTACSASANLSTAVPVETLFDFLERNDIHAEK